MTEAEIKQLADKIKNNTATEEEKSKVLDFLYKSLVEIKDILKKSESKK